MRYIFRNLMKYNRIVKLLPFLALVNQLSWISSNVITDQNLFNAHNSNIKNTKYYLWNYLAALKQTKKILTQTQPSHIHYTTHTQHYRCRQWIQTLLSGIMKWRLFDTWWLHTCCVDCEVEKWHGMDYMMGIHVNHGAVRFRKNLWAPVTTHRKEGSMRGSPFDWSE